jgi:hypothetical protein
MRHTVKTSTALRVWRWFTQAIWLVVAMGYAAGTYNLPFTIWGTLVTLGVWWMGKTIIIVTSKNGKFELYKII